MTTTPSNPPETKAPRLRRMHGVSTMRIRPGAYELRKRGAARFDFSDPYHLAVGLSWPGFALLFVGLEFGINSLFAGLYLLQPGSIANAQPGSLSDAFFFSLETLATVGYGAMSPATLYGHIVSAAEIVTGMAFVAIMTGLTFVRFARPKGKILFAEKAVVATHNGHPTLMVRIANGRMVTLTDASARMSALLQERTLEGNIFRGIHELKLIRPRVPLFPLTWTLMHRIDEDSPLFGRAAADLRREQTRVFISVEVRDPVLAAQVYAIRDYGADDIALRHRYADAVSLDSHGRTIADLTRISLIEPDPHAPAATAAPVLTE